MTTIQIQSGQTAQFTFKILDRETGGYLSLAGGTLYCTIKSSAALADVDAEYSGSVATSGSSYVFTISSADTAALLSTGQDRKTYLMDFKFKTSGSVEYITRRIQLVVEQAITRRSS